MSMCFHCKTDDDEEANHGHKCTDECMKMCSICGDHVCAYGSDIVITNVDGVLTRMCKACFIESLSEVSGVK